MIQRQGQFRKRGIRYTERITISKDELKDIKRLLRRKTEDKNVGDVPYTYTVRFSNGMEADIKVCNGNSPYVDAVLFKDGSEVSVLDVSENILGLYDFKYKNDTYLVIVE